MEKLHATLKNIKLKDIDGKGSLKYEYKRPNSNDGVTFTIPVGTLFGSLFGGYTACTEYAKFLQTIQSSEETLRITKTSSSENVVAIKNLRRTRRKRGHPTENHIRERS